MVPRDRQDARAAGVRGKGGRFWHALPRATLMVLTGAALTLAAAPASPHASAQDEIGSNNTDGPTDLRLAHQIAERSTVIVQSDLGEASGWVAELDGTRVVITNRHAVGELNHAELTFADRQHLRAVVVHRSDTLDMAVLATREDIRAPALVRAYRPIIRGERVVLSGHPGGMHFITSEGVIAGAASGLPETDRACGVRRNCIVLDAETHFGNSGGPVVDARGHCIGMVWGGMTSTSFSLAIHAETLFDELRAVERHIHRRRRVYRHRRQGRR